MLKTSSIIYSVIILTMAVFSILTVVGILSQNYSISVNLQSLNKTVQLGSQINQSYQSFNSNNPATTALGITGLLIVGAANIWTFIQLFLSTPEILGGIINDFLTIMGIPAEITGALMIGILAAALFGFLYFLTGRET